MSKEECLLLVEGLNDKSFYEEFCRAHALMTSVTVAKPKDVGGRRNTKQGAINHLPLLLQQLADGRLKKLALIVDADQIVDGGGFLRTVEQVASVIQPFDYSVQPEILAGGGLIFPHNDGLAEFGLWVMPNNRDDGSLEHWIQDCVHFNEVNLFLKAKDSLKDLDPTKFDEIRVPKAEVATWLAWQRKPGEGHYFTIAENLLDQTSEKYAALKNWMERIFK
jgi:hypothetical protein